MSPARAISTCLLLLQVLRGPNFAAALTPEDDKEINKHFEDAEDFTLKGHFPTPGSGVTIASGIDLGQFTERELKARGVPQNLIDRFRPYLSPLKTQSAVEAAGKDANKLTITEEEGKLLNYLFIKWARDKVEPYFGSLSPKGKAVLVSVRHWNGGLWNSKDDRKLTRLVNGKPVSYVWDAVKNKDATDDTLLQALKKTPRMAKGSAAYNRIQAEIDYLQTK